MLDRTLHYPLPQWISGSISIASLTRNGAGTAVQPPYQWPCRNRVEERMTAPSAELHSSAACPALRALKSAPRRSAPLCAARHYADITPDDGGPDTRTPYGQIMNSRSTANISPGALPDSH